MTDDPLLGFREFWTQYPRKIARKAAATAWTRLRPDAALRAQMAEALTRQIASAQWQTLRFIPYPATWLHGERWLDELPNATLSPRVTRLADAAAAFERSSTGTSSRKPSPGSRSR